MKNPICLFFALVMVIVAPVRAESISIAVAANFHQVAQMITEDFKLWLQENGDDTDVRLDLISGSSGKLYAQIIHGAPFDVFLSADQKTVKKLIDEGYGVEKTRFTYVKGVLALMTQEQDNGKGISEVLRLNNVKRISMAQPKMAPYGRASMQVLKFLNMDASLAGRIVYGENVAQAYRFYRSQSVTHSFVPLSFALKSGFSYVLVPEIFYDPIKQDAVVLKRTEKGALANTFVEYLKGARAQGIARASGYGVIEMRDVE